MKNILPLLLLLSFSVAACYAQTAATSPQFKIFEQTLSAANLQFSFPKDFKEIKALHTVTTNVDYAMELPNANFQVWYKVKDLQKEWPKFKVTEDDPKRSATNPDSLYNLESLSAATKLAGKDNFTAKTLPPDLLTVFHADEGKSYQLNLYDRPETGHYQYGLLMCLQKNGTGYILMLFLGNENGPEFYKKVNKAYYSVRFN
ncbi:hypothetical protein [Mucilaginibacter arboris]|uniref:PsbP C-terminal domain-containing protein n=1 Tax=Mucilaginibacter arboris TaxID=2682090 RepID=A0A7K1SUI0_9SPHI|nr:hypothetical protein [Mucilaginibacter arboris]MVN20981.1 hypothetical protein [Mucilaginibacter arboris]